MQLTAEMIREAFEAGSKKGFKVEYIISTQAWDLAMKILKKKPNKILYREWHIRAVAKEMGIV